MFELIVVATLLIVLIFQNPALRNPLPPKKTKRGNERARLY